MPTDESRRATLRALGIIGGVFVVPVTAGVVLAHFDERQRKEPPKHYVHTYELFGGDVTVTRTETTQRIQFDEVTTGTQFDFEIKAPGDYVIQGWVSRYRDRDTKEEEWSYHVDGPQRFTENTQNRVYRLEASRVRGGQLEQDSRALDWYEGRIPAQFIGVGDQQ